HTSFSRDWSSDVCSSDLDPPGGMFSHLPYRRIHWAELPELVRVVVWCDPAVTATDDSDCNGIIADGIAKDGTIYRLWAWEGRSTDRKSVVQGESGWDAAR